MHVAVSLKVVWPDYGHLCKQTEMLRKQMYILIFPGGGIARVNCKLTFAVFTIIKNIILLILNALNNRERKNETQDHNYLTKLVVAFVSITRVFDQNQQPPRLWGVDLLHEHFFPQDDLRTPAPRALNVSLTVTFLPLQTSLESHPSTVTRTTSTTAPAATTCTRHSGRLSDVYGGSGPRMALRTPAPVAGDNDSKVVRWDSFWTSGGWVNICLCLHCLLIYTLSIYLFNDLCSLFIHIFIDSLPPL